MQELNDIPGYFVTEDGRVWSAAKDNCQNRDGKWLKPSIRNGYPCVRPRVNGSAVNRYVHRLVAQAFCVKNDGTEVNHKNGIKTDNRAENLEWVTHSANIQHSYDVLNHARTMGTGRNQYSCP